MKCIVLFMLLLLALSAPVADVSAEISFDTPITMKVNDTLIKTESAAFLHNGITYVPIRFVAQALGAEHVGWDENNETAIIKHQGTTIELPKNKKFAFLNGKKVNITNGSKVVNDRSYVPVRFVAETLNCNVDWVFSTYTVNISKEGITIPENLIASRFYTDDDIYWLSKIIHAESRGEPMQGKIAVGNVVLNRVKDKNYPNTIYGVIFDRKNGVQFSPILDGSIHQSPFGDSVIAAKRALEGESAVGSCLFFLNPKTAQNSWIIHNRPYYKTINNHDFYL